jgi:hypothetical protein
MDKVVNGQTGPLTKNNKYTVREKQRTVKNHHSHLPSITIMYQLQVSYTIIIFRS